MPKRSLEIKQSPPPTADNTVSRSPPHRHAPLTPLSPNHQRGPRQKPAETRHYNIPEETSTLCIFGMRMVTPCFGGRDVRPLKVADQQMRNCAIVGTFAMTTIRAPKLVGVLFRAGFRAQRYSRSGWPDVNVSYSWCVSRSPFLFAEVVCSRASPSG